ncbi:hypothetical protein UPYG_G00070050 [Umbra pygmaea]|uniref:Uncharacterized protein n=1 Tax=Umbra pygmaea TaxID=75934 RepID=A0ABD0XEY7_UMBPY
MQDIVEQELRRQKESCWWSWSTLSRLELAWPGVWMGVRGSWIRERSQARCVRVGNPADSCEDQTYLKPCTPTGHWT